MVTVQNLKTTHGEYGSNRPQNIEKLNYDVNVQDVAGRVEGANNKLNVILHGAHFVFIRSLIPF
jgi:hypothetical protein